MPPRMPRTTYWKPYPAMPTTSIAVMNDVPSNSPCVSVPQANRAVIPTKTSKHP